MPDTPSFVVNDRRKFNSEGELRHDLPESPTSPESTGAASPQPTAGPQLVSSAPAPAGDPAELTDLPESSAFPAGTPEDFSDGFADRDLQAGPADYGDEPLPPAPTDEQTADAIRAYDATVDRLDTALRAADPGGERMPEMSFERLTQSLYTQALMLLGGATQPGEQPRVDILGARQTIDMLAIIEAKTKGNLSPDEGKLLQSALFDLRMGFLEITQALARQARQGAGPGAPGGMNPGGAGPRIVR